MSEVIAQFRYLSIPSFYEMIDTILEESQIRPSLYSRLITALLMVDADEELCKWVYICKPYAAYYLPDAVFNQFSQAIYI